MRLDLFLSKVGLIKRRTIAKELADNGMIRVNEQKAKPSKELEVGDIISIGGKRPITVEIKAIPAGSVKKEDRDAYYLKLA
jgi:ribosomal 50S subunit-recycling heat shock protein